MGGKLPSAHYYLGVALYRRNQLNEAATEFAKAIQLYDNDLQSWLALGDSYLCQFQVVLACMAFENAIIVRKLTDDVSKLYKSRNWIADWTDRDVMNIRIRRMIQERLEQQLNPGVMAADFFELSPQTILQVSRYSHLAQPATEVVPLQTKTPSSKVLRVGFISADFGIHPVATLIRGMLASFDYNSFEVRNVN